MNRLAIARVTIAVVAVAFILLPGEAWSSSESDYKQAGFDPELVYATPMSQSAYDPFLASQQGTREACPCLAGSLVTLTGSGLAPSRAEDSVGTLELGGTRVLVAGEPALLHLVAPSQIDLDLPADLIGPTATVEVVRDGETIGRDVIAIGDTPPTGGTSVTGAALRLTADAAAEPEVHLITTPLSFRASSTVTVEDQTAGSIPLRIKLWNPRNSSSLELVFGGDRHVYGVFSDGPGHVARQGSMIAYEIGVSYDVNVQWQRGERAALSITHGGEASTFEITAAEAPALFDAYRPTLTVGAAAREGASAASLTNYHFELPPERFTTLRVNDPLVAPLVGVLAVLGALLLMASVASASAVRRTGADIARWTRSLRRHFREHPVGSAVLTSALVSYVAVNCVLFTLGSHPFDMNSQATWSYIATEYGLTDLYYVSQTATLADVWNGVPYHEAVFPYNAGMSYYFWIIGETHLLLFGNASPDMSMQMMIKTFNLAFLLADAALIYATVRTLKPDSTHLPWVVSAIVLLNPAVMFDTAIWGETEAVVLFPLLASLLAALKDRPGIAWPFLALAFLSKQTVLLPVLAMAMVYLFRFDLRRNLEGFASAMVAVVAVILPFTMNGYPPSIAIDPTVAAIWVHGGSGAEKAFQVVSYDSFNVWTLVTFLADGAVGLARFQTPDYGARLGALSFHEMGLIALAVALGLFALAAFTRRRALRGAEHGIAVAVALVFVLELFLPTQTLSRYYIFAVVFAAIGLAGPSRWLSGSALIAVTVTAFVGQYGSLALVLDEFPNHAEHLAPQNNALSWLMADLFISNGFITVAGLLNGFAAFALGAAFWRAAARPLPAAAPLQAAPAGVSEGVFSDCAGARAERGVAG